VVGNLFVGILSVISVGGLGRLAIRPLRPLVLHWYATLALLAGFALSSVCVQCLAMAGSGRTGFLMLGAAIVVLGFAGHWLGRGRYSQPRMPLPCSLRTLAIGLLCLAVGVPALISLAPSSKIDEIHYHMLVGHRVLEDHGLRVYQLPAEQAIVPQMGYQIAQTVFHATNTPDAGNILSFGFGVALWLLIYGVVTEETGRPEAGWIALVVAAIGMYPAVWYVTAGPHALGDLATFAGVAALLFPGALAAPNAAAPDKTRWFVCVLAAACAASTKISLVPVGMIITLLALLRRNPTKSLKARIPLLAMAAGVWLLVMGPLIVWTSLHTGSPFGAAFAEYFGRTSYQPVVLRALADSRKANQTGLRTALYYVAQFLNGAAIFLIVWGAIFCCWRWRRFSALSFLFVLQVVLIAMLLPHDFRFLGGLQYGLLVAGMIGIAPLLPSPITFRWAAAGAIVLLAPWLVAEVFYARPFVAVALGIDTREKFLQRYVAFTDDFRALDNILPSDAVLYVPDDRLPAVYAPRPVIFTLADWNGRTPVYKFLVLSSLVLSSNDPPGAASAGSQEGLTCGEVVYRNSNAIVVAYRTPGRAPARGLLVVRRCVPLAGTG